MNARPDAQSHGTGDDFMSQLTQDPKYVQMLREKEEEAERNHAEFMELERPVLADLHRIGVAVPSVGNAAFFKPYVPLNEQVVEVLLHWAPKAPPRVRECLVRLLAAAGRRFDGRVLTDLFDANEDTSFRWVIANTLEAAKPLKVEGWLKDRVMGAMVLDSWRPLFAALCKLSDTGTILAAARRHVEMFPDVVGPILGKVGTRDDIPLLKRIMTREEPSVQRKLNSAIGKIEKRHPD